jgi:hypothetical protein
MRVISFLFSSLFGLAVVLIVGGLVGRELLLLAGASTIRSSLTTLHKISRDNLQYARMCREKGGNSIDGATVGALNLRFLSSTRYVLEVVCSQFISDPILVETYNLPFFVKKTPGSSGITWSPERSAVELEVFGRKTIIGIENEQITSFASGSVSLGLSPQSTCEGHGYMCCQNETHSGTGQPYSSVSDCPRSCFAQCIPRPLILSLNSDPFVEEGTRTATTPNGQPVIFTFVASYEKAEPVTITLDFGDGQQETFTKLNGSTNHTYSCPSGGCTFPVTISAVSKSGVQSTATPITRLTIVVQ